MVGEYIHAQFADGETDTQRSAVQHFQKCLVLGGRHFPRFSEMLIVWSLSGHQLKCLAFTKLESIWYWLKSEKTLKNIGLTHFLGSKGSTGILDIAVIPTSLLCYSTIDCSLYLLFFRWWLCLTWPPLPSLCQNPYVMKLCIAVSHFVVVVLTSLNHEQHKEILFYFSLSQGHSDAEDSRNPRTLRESSQNHRIS